MTQHHARNVRLFGGVRIGVDDDVIARLPRRQPVWPRAGGMGLQPGVAQIVVGLVGQHRLHVDHAADIRRQAVQHEAGGFCLGRQLHLQRVIVHRADELLHVVRVEAELGDDEAGCLVQLHDSLQAERRVMRGDRVAGIELRVLLQLEREGQSVGADVVAFGKVAGHLGGVGGIGTHQPAVAVAVHLIVGEFVGFGWVEGDDVIDLPHHHHGVLRCGGTGVADDIGRRERCGRACQQAAAGQHVGVSQSWTAATLPRPRAGR